MRKYIIIFFIVATTSAWSAGLYYYNGNAKVTLTPVSSDTSRSVNSSVTYYLDANGKRLGVKDQILVTTDADISTIAVEHNAIVVRKLAKNLYLLQVDDPSRVIDTANTLHEDSRVQDAHPNFLRSVELR